MRRHGDPGGAGSTVVSPALPVKAAWPDSAWAMTPPWSRSIACASGDSAASFIAPTTTVSVLLPGFLTKATVTGMADPFISVRKIRPALRMGCNSLFRGGAA